MTAKGLVRTLRKTSARVALALAALLAYGSTGGVKAQGQSDEPFVIIPVDPPANSGEEASANPAAPPRDRPAPAEDEAAPREPPREWYGWQTLALDGSSLIVMTAGAATADDGGPLVVGLGGYLLGTPIVHGLHRNDWAWPSLGMRAGSLALVGGGIAVLVGGCWSVESDMRPSSCGDRRTAGSVLLFSGIALAVTSIAVDAVLARSPPVKPDTPRLGLWGDPLTGAAGVSVSLVR